jgi:hypothetical protein
LLMTASFAAPHLVERVQNGLVIAGRSTPSDTHALLRHHLPQHMGAPSAS